MTRPEIDHTMCKIDQCYLCQDHQHHYCLKDISAWSTMLWLRWKSCVSSLLIGGGLIRLNCHKKCRLVSEADRIWQGATNLATFTFWQPEPGCFNNDTQVYMSYFTFGKNIQHFQWKGTLSLECVLSPVKTMLCKMRLTTINALMHNYKRKGFNNQDSTAISRLGGFQNSQTTGTLLEVQLAASGIFEQSLLVASYPLWPRWSLWLVHLPSFNCLGIRSGVEFIPINIFCVSCFETKMFVFLTRRYLAMMMFVVGHLQEVNF